MNYRKIITVVGLCAALGACAQYDRTPTGATAQLSGIAVDPQQASAIISAYRRAHGLSPVVVEPMLNGFARQQAAAMASADQLSHEVAGGLTARLGRAGIAQRTAVENVSAGYQSTARVIAGWQRSPGHNQNLLDPSARRMGIAAVASPGGHYKSYWSLVMTN
ncbi:MAG: CAP domain-containing protein [Hyphomicrobiales bacterium]|nr:CAP domain-containing protein [Hyphomicrobiales bacterium]